jgi:hypothetical protein
VQNHLQLKNRMNLVLENFMVKCVSLPCVLVAHILS